MKKVELLAPAGDLDKLKIAILYGADAVFVGGKYFSLRHKASNFTIEELKEAVDFANKHHARIHVTVNIVPEEDDFDKLDEYLLTLDSIGVHAIIVSSIYVMQRAKALNCKFEIHVSTQQSILNYKAIDFFNEVGANRVVLGRELSIEQIKNIKEHSPLPIEVFIHGGMCSSYSGRCTLSNVMVNRDANKGGCAHSCRWLYRLSKDNTEIGKDDFIIASCDLMSVKYIPTLLSIGVDSFKIEGRMKSVHYIATIVSAYRRLIDEYYENNGISNERIRYYINEINKAENRITYTGFLDKRLKNQVILKETGNERQTQSFVAIVLHHKNKDGLTLIEEKNNFSIKDKLEAFLPDGTTQKIKIKKMYDLDGNEVEIARHAREPLLVKLDKEIPIYSLIRKSKVIK